MFQTPVQCEFRSLKVSTQGPRIEDSNQEGLVTSLLLLGAFFACPSAGYFADRVGRRVSIIVGCIIFLFGASLQTGAQNINMARVLPARDDTLLTLFRASQMMAGRFFAGWGIVSALRCCISVALGLTRVGRDGCRCVLCEAGGWRRY